MLESSEAPDGALCDWHTAPVVEKDARHCELLLSMVADFSRRLNQLFSIGVTGSMNGQQKTPSTYIPTMV
jgi:hypothetical protein